MFIIRPHRTQYASYNSFVCSLILVGCDTANCVINNHPEFSKNSVREATLNQVFEDIIGVSISNSIEDNEYDYAWTLEGDLPPGIGHETSAREISFSGTPTELGDFPFRLTVVATAKFLGPNVDPEREPEELCSATESRDMVFSVIQGF